MQKYLLRQHLLMTEKYRDCERSWSEIGKFIEIPEKQGKLNNYLRPQVPISQAAHWYLIAKQNESAKNRVIKLSLFYPMSLIILSIMIMQMVSLFVLPEFENIYLSSEQNLPLLSGFIFLHLESMITLLAFTLFFILFFSLMINSRLKRLKPINNLLKLLIVFTPQIKLHNQYCAHIKLVAWELLNIKIQEQSLDGLISTEEFVLASKTDNLKNTLTYASPDMDPHQMMLMNQRLNTLITLFIGVIIGVFIIGVYLPIFSLGQQF